MIHPFSPVEDQIEKYFPTESHPYRILEDRIAASLQPGHALLDIGCGRTAPTLTKFKSQAKTLIGVDLVEFVEGIDGVQLVNESITEMESIESNSIDIAYARSVMEHVAEAEEAFSEVHRILKPGGKFMFLTANRYDYASIVASLIPNRFHAGIVKATEGRDEIDTFPTTYKANTKRRILSLAKESGLDVTLFERQTQYPNYLVFSRVLFWIGSQYERLLRSTELLSALRGWIYCEVTKR